MVRVRQPGTQMALGVSIEKVISIQIVPGLQEIATHGNFVLISKYCSEINQCVDDGSCQYFW